MNKSLIKKKERQIFEAFSEYAKDWNYVKCRHLELCNLQFDEKIYTLKFSSQIAEFTVLDLDI